MPNAGREISLIFMTEPPGAVHHGHHPHPHRHRPGHGPAPEDDTDLARLLDLDGTLGASVLTTALTAAADAMKTPPHTIADLGAGTGTGTLALAAHFPLAKVLSLDSSPTMIHRLRTAATAGGVADRVETRLNDLDGDWPAALPGRLDLVWAALSLHHVGDPARTLRQVFEALRPGGALVVMEMTGTSSYHPTDMGTSNSGLGPRLVQALAGRGYPTMGEWTTALHAAGFSPVERIEAPFNASADTPLGAQYLELHLTLNRDMVAEDLSIADLAALDSVIAALHGEKSSLEYTSGRVIWIAVRPTHSTNDPYENGSPR